MKKQSHGSVKKNGKGYGNGGNKQFQLVNGVITKEDITPLASSSPQRSTTSSDEEGSNSTATESDLLFSPISSAVDEEEDEDEYDHELLSPIYFGASYPKRFHHSSHASDQLGRESRKGSLCGQFWKDLLGNTTNGDFWKEVGTTNEEAIFASEPLQELSTESSPLEDHSNTTLDQFIKEDATAPASSALSAAQWDDDYKIKLLCYRDTTGNLRLRTQEDNSNVARGLVTESTNLKVRKIRKGKGKSRLLKNAIRRKSGVREMVSTGVGIGEFML